VDVAYLPNVTPLLEIVGKYEKKPFGVRVLGNNFVFW